MERTIHERPERETLSLTKKTKELPVRGIIMTHPPRITDESVLTRWMSMEIGKINEDRLVSFVW